VTVNRMILDQLGRQSNVGHRDPDAAPIGFDGGAARGPIPRRGGYDSRYGPATAGELFRMALRQSQAEQRERVFGDGHIRGVERD